MSTGKTTLALLLSALLPAGAAWPQAMTLWSTAQKPLRSPSIRRSPTPVRRSSPARRYCITVW